MRLTRSLLWDILLALALTGLAMASTARGFGAVQESGTEVDATALGLVGATGLALVVRRRWPYLTLAAASLFTATYLLLGYPFGLALLLYSVAVYAVARHRPLARSAPAAIGSLVVLLAHVLVGGGEGALGLAYGTAWAAVPFAIGVTVRARREIAERDRAEVIRAHVDEERLRVAQEVHDIVGHGLAAIRMQAEVALHVLAKRPEQAETALAAISRTSGDALEELRATLAVVRDSGGEQDRSPAPGLAARLGELRQRMGDAGLSVRLETTGEPRSLPAGIELNGYRIVQESLTNVLRHSGAGDATVIVRYGSDAVDLVVSNQVLSAPRNGNGSGIAGMRQRAEALGGTFSAAPTLDGRFEVRASLPTGGDS